MLISLSAGVKGYEVKIDFHDGGVKSFDIPHGNLTANDLLQNPRSVVFHQEAPNEKRQDGPHGCIPHTSHYYQLVGDGNPHQNYKIGQVANTLISCPGSVTQGESHTFGWSVQVGLNPGFQESDFASVGFSVTETNTESVSETFPCAGDTTEICAIHYTAVTALTVRFYQELLGCGSPVSKEVGQGIVYLPNANGVGSTISRGTNFGDRNIIQCRGQAERNLDFYCGPKGGPEWFQTNEYGPWSDAYMEQKEPADCAVPIEALKFNDGEKSGAKRVRRFAA